MKFLKLDTSGRTLTPDCHPSFTRNILDEINKYSIHYLILAFLYSLESQMNSYSGYSIFLGIPDEVIFWLIYIPWNPR